MAVTAAHCTVEKVTNPMDPVPQPVVLKVFNTKNEDTYISAKPVYNFDHADISIIEGDFRSFNKIALDTKTFELKKGDKLIACGYAGGYPLACVKGEHDKTFMFFGEMTNYVAKGMSGGPVLNKNFKLIGINSHRTDNTNSRYGILFGILKEPK